MSSQLKTPWEKVVFVEPENDAVLRLKWEDGRQSKIDLSTRIYERDIFWRLRNPRYFKQVSVDKLGGICWPEGEDLSPEYLAKFSH
ncbi:MAG: DUF2442 domain-containing protein [Calditrichaeota bacterium]|nr:MAG: DUF2442 domain-containing protein [Calditrichota bacterium]